MLSTNPLPVNRENVRLKKKYSILLPVQSSLNVLWLLNPKNNSLFIDLTKWVICNLKHFFFTKLIHQVPQTHFDHSANAQSQTSHMWPRSHMLRPLACTNDIYQWQWLFGHDWSCYCPDLGQFFSFALGLTLTPHPNPVRSATPWTVSCSMFLTVGGNNSTQRKA